MANQSNINLGLDYQILHLIMGSFGEWDGKIDNNRVIKDEMHYDQRLFLIRFCSGVRSLWNIHDISGSNQGL